MEESLNSTGAVVMGRNMFSGGDGPWDTDPSADGWWGEDPPLRVPVFIVTHHAREPVEKQRGTTFTFVTDGAGRALALAKEAAGDRNVSVAGGANTIQQLLRAGSVDEIQMHVTPMLLGDGTRLFEGLGSEEVRLEPVSTTGSFTVSHLRFRVAK